MTGHFHIMEKRSYLFSGHFCVILFHHSPPGPNGIIPGMCCIHWSRDRSVDRKHSSYGGVRSSSPPRSIMKLH